MPTTRTITGAIAALVFLTPSAGASNMQTLAGEQQSQQIELDYESSLAGAPASSNACAGGALSGSLDCVSEMMDGDAGGTDETSRAALAAVPVTPKVASGTDDESDKRIVVITLLTRTGKIDSIDAFSPADQTKLRRDLFLAKRRLDDWRLRLSDDQARRLLDDELPVRVSISDGWDRLSLLKPTQTQITILPPGTRMTAEEAAMANRMNRTVDIGMHALAAVDAGVLRLVTRNFGDTPATALEFEFEHNGPMCPYSGGCDDAGSGYPNSAELCTDGTSSRPKACLACLRDAEAAKGNKARYMCPNGELRPGARAELRLKLAFKAARDDPAADRDDVVLDAEPVSECKDWPALAIIVSSREQDSNPGNNKDSILTPGFGPSITGLQFKLQPLGRQGDRLPSPDAKTASEAEPADSVYLEAQLDGPHCGFDAGDKDRPAGYALMKVGAEKYDTQVPLLASRKGTSVLRSKVIRLSDALERLGNGQSAGTPGSPGVGAHNYPFDISAEAERATAKLTIHGAQEGFARVASLSIRPKTDTTRDPSYPEARALPAGGNFDLALTFDLDRANIPQSLRIRFQHWRGERLIGRDVLRVNRRHENANTAVEGTFVSDLLIVDESLANTEFFPGDELRVIYDEADNGKKERAKSTGDRVTLIAPAVAVKDIELASGRTRQQVSTDEVFEARVSFETKPHSDPGLVGLRLLRAGTVVGERVAPLSWKDKGAGMAAAIVNLADDQPFSNVAVGDRIEARYGDGKWAEYSTATLSVIGSPGKLESLKILVDHKQATELPVGSKMAVEAVYETAPKDGIAPGSVNIETGVDYLSGGERPQSLLLELKADTADARRYVSDTLHLSGPGAEHDGPGLNVLPGYDVGASLANLTATGSVVAGDLADDRARVTVTAYTVDGHREDARVYFRGDREQFRMLANHTADLPAGTYDFRIDLDVIYHGSVTLQAGRDATIEVPKPDRGRLLVELVDGNGARQTPDRVSLTPTSTLPEGWGRGGLVDRKSRLDVPHGTYTVLVEANGWSKRFADIRIEPGKTTRLPAGGGRGKLEFSVLDVNDKKLERTFSVGSVSSLSSTGTVDLEPGTYSIRVRAPFSAVVNKVVVSAGEKTVENLRLGRLDITGIDPGTGKSGSVKVNVTRLNTGTGDREWWSGKSTNLDVPPGTYLVHFVDVDEQQTVRVSAGRRTPVAQKTQAGWLKIDLSQMAELRTPEFERWECRIYRTGSIASIGSGCGSRYKSRVELLPTGEYFLDVRNPVQGISQEIDFTIRPNRTTTVMPGQY